MDPGFSSFSDSTRPFTRRECAHIDAASMPSPMSEATPKLPPEQQVFAIDCNLSAKFFQFVHSDVPQKHLYSLYSLHVEQLMLD